MICFIQLVVTLQNILMILPALKCPSCMQCAKHLTRECCLVARHTRTMTEGPNDKQLLHGPNGSCMSKPATHTYLVWWR
jgi:hypothetical protein